MQTNVRKSFVFSAIQTGIVPGAATEDLHEHFRFVMKVDTISTLSAFQETFTCLYGVFACTYKDLSIGLIQCRFVCLSDSL